mgnify:CR=1 FL=1
MRIKVILFPRQNRYFQVNDFYKNNYLNFVTLYPQFRFRLNPYTGPKRRLKQRAIRKFYSGVSFNSALSVPRADPRAAETTDSAIPPHPRTGCRHHQSVGGYNHSGAWMDQNTVTGSVTRRESAFSVPRRSTKRKGGLNAYRRTLIPGKFTG